MNIHEYQAKELLARYGVAVPRGHVAYTAEEAGQAAAELGGDVWVVKAQIHAGGRGKGGGVKVVKSKDEVEKTAKDMIGMNLVTHQTGPEGKEVKRVYIEEGCDIARELYLGVLIDRATSRITFMASTEGGMDIEEVADKTPERIRSVQVDPAAGLMPYQARELGFFLGLDKDQVGQLTRIMDGLYRMFIEQDASLVEINPLIVTDGGDLRALDAKLNFDDNALYRHKDIAAMRDPSQEDERERIALQHDLHYVPLDGNIGCMVNGAGLAMATMDIIKLHGGAPANFLDVGGGTTAERVAEAFKLIISGADVKAIFVNIFGGIVRCDLIAEGIIAAVKDVGIKIPVVVRLQGTNMEQGREMLASSGLAITPESDLTAAAKAVVAAAQ